MTDDRVEIIDRSVEKTHLRLNELGRSLRPTTRATPTGPCGP
jgi:hypothetical protein